MPSPDKLDGTGTSFKGDIIYADQPLQKPTGHCWRYYSSFTSIHCFKV